jgi:hypothetical protein
MQMTTTKITTRVLLAGFAGAVALLAFGTAGAGAAPSASLEATKGCYLQVINDWLDNNQVDRIYAIPCYSQAIQHLSQYPDVQGYSSAEDDIRRAWLAAVRQDRGGPTSGSSGPSEPSGGGGSTPTGTESPTGSESQSPQPSFFTSLGHKIGPGDAQTVPLPLLVLGGLALLLLLAAAGTWFARRMQARRATPAPAPAPAPTRRP